MKRVFLLLIKLIWLLILHLCKAVVLLALPASAILLVIAIIVASISRDLPDCRIFSYYAPPTITKIYSATGEKIAEFANERRSIIRYNEIPQCVVDAFLSAEDKKFFTHSGFSMSSIMRAGRQTIINLMHRKRAVGASTITQQVVRALMLNDRREIERKVQEVILAYRVTALYSKEQILEIYLNQIFLGANSYGIVSAARTYFGKEVDNLTVAEAAMLAGLPKAPSTLNPFSNPDRAIARRNWVISRMAKNDFISQAEAESAIEQELVLNNRRGRILPDNSAYYIDEVRKELLTLFGEERLYSGGMTVMTNMRSDIQKKANSALINGIQAYDIKHGWRGPIDHIPIASDSIYDGVSLSDARVKLRKMEANRVTLGAEHQNSLALVVNVRKNSASVMMKSGEKKTVFMKDLRAQRMFKSIVKQNPEDDSMQLLVKKGDVVLVRQKGNVLLFDQIPNVNGAIVVLEPYTFKVLAMVGGYSAKESEFNRATMAERQIGSLFKPFIYLSALENGFSANDMILDGPISVKMENGAIWSPKNHDDKYMGEISLSTALRRSRNTPVVRLSMLAGIDATMGMASRFGIYSGKYRKTDYAVALGAFSTNLMKVTAAYNALASGGVLSERKFISAVYDRNGEMIYHDKSVRCAGCLDSTEKLIKRRPVFTHFVRRIAKAHHIKQLESMLLRRSHDDRFSFISKTGTTNYSNDAWCVGYASDFTTGVYIGFDAPKTLGHREYGATVAFPIFKKFYDYLPDEECAANIDAVPQSMLMFNAGLDSLMTD